MTWLLYYGTRLCYYDIGLTELSSIILFRLINVVEGIIKFPLSPGFDYIGLSVGGWRTNNRLGKLLLSWEPKTWNMGVIRHEEESSPWYGAASGLQWPVTMGSHWSTMALRLRVVRWPTANKKENKRRYIYSQKSWKITINVLIPQLCIALIRSIVLIMSQF